MQPNSGTHRAYSVALTGGIASGKSTVAEAFGRRGVPVFDADLVARDLVRPGQSALAEIAVAFGEAMLTASGELDRRRMRERVWEAAHVGLSVVTLDTDTTVHTLFGNQMGGRKSYNPKNKGKRSYQRMSSEGWCIQWESTPPEQKSEFCSLDSRAGRKLNPGSLSTKPSLGW